jgi:MoaA/NifB/PqqE/SkfB family radical SAM enzyme
LFAFSSQTTNLARLRFVKFIGGEPFVRKDVVLRATEFCIHEGILVSYDTNLTLIDENDIKFYENLAMLKEFL